MDVAFTSLSSSGRQRGEGLSRPLANNVRKGVQVTSAHTLKTSLWTCSRAIPPLFVGPDHNNGSFDISISVLEIWACSICVLIRSLIAEIWESHSDGVSAEPNGGGNRLGHVAVSSINPGRCRSWPWAQTKVRFVSMQVFTRKVEDFTDFGPYIPLSFIGQVNAEGLPSCHSLGFVWKQDCIHSPIMAHFHLFMLCISQHSIFTGPANFTGATPPLRRLLRRQASTVSTCLQFHFAGSLPRLMMCPFCKVCITVSASRAQSDAAQRLLLNHISTPHVTLASAVAASCALPGVMRPAKVDLFWHAFCFALASFLYIWIHVFLPAKLKAKNSDGKIEDFEVDGVEWIDGSVQADLPFQRISTLFNVSNFVVCQTNFHVVPFLNKEHITKSTYQSLFQTIEWDIRSRALKLSGLGLFPKVFGHDISEFYISFCYKKLSAIYIFDTTFLPFYLGMVYTAYEYFFRQSIQTEVSWQCDFSSSIYNNAYSWFAGSIKSKVSFTYYFMIKSYLRNTHVWHFLQSEKDMEQYIHFGQLAAWPYLRVIRYMLRLEISLDEGLERLKSRVQELGSDFDEADDVDSIAGSIASCSTSALATSQMRTVRFAIPSPQLESLQNKLAASETENRMLRKELEDLRRKFASFQSRT